jgi:AcrR family transcriptional regulator
MEADTVEEKRGAGRGAVRYGRPPRERAGRVEERILDAAGRVFLEHGFQGASVNEIAEVASAGKPTIYARFPSKQALFAAVIDRLVRRNTSLDAFSCHGISIEHRLDTLAAVMLTRVLTPETVGLIRVAVAEARRLPDLATSVSCMGRQRPTEAVAPVCLASWRHPTPSGLPPRSRRKSSRRRRAVFSIWWCCRCCCGRSSAKI